jgi:hypothetical protein
MALLPATGDGGGVAIVVDSYGRREGRKSVVGEKMGGKVP